MFYGKESVEGGFGLHGFPTIDLDLNNDICIGIGLDIVYSLTFIYLPVCRPVSLSLFCFSLSIYIHVYIYIHVCYMGVSKNRGPRYKPQLVGLLLEGHSQKGPRNSRHSHLHICIYIYMICIFTYTYTDVCIYIYIHLSMSLSLSLSLYIHIYVGVVTIHVCPCV